MKTLLIILGIVLVVVLGLFLFTDVFTVTPGEDQGVNGTTTPTTTPTTQTVSIAVLDRDGATTGPERGCDRLVLIERTIPSTTTPLTAALETLFTLNETTTEGHYNFIARTNDTLAFDRAEVRDGTAHIYLTGELSGLAGVCDDPRTAIQIEETALQFPTVDDVQLYLNNEETTLIPSQQ